MSGQQIKVDFGSLGELQGQVNQAATRLLGSIDEIKSTVNGVHSYWEGSANEQFNAKYQQLDQGARQVQEAIAGFAQLILKAQDAYTQAESQNKSLFG